MIPLVGDIWNGQTQGQKGQQQFPGEGTAVTQDMNALDGSLENGKVNSMNI